MSAPSSSRDHHVLKRSHGLAVDHIGLGVSETHEGVRMVAEDTGVTPFLTEPEPRQWYRSAGLPVGDDSFLEVIGPNPDHTGFHPLKEYLLGLDEPTLIFWYIATANFDELRQAVASRGVPLERVESVDGPESSYTRGILGPGFISQRPCVIEWTRREPRHQTDRKCWLEGFRLAHPNAARFNRLFDAIGIDMRVEKGPSEIAVKLSTPQGPVTYANPGVEFAGPLGALRMATLFNRYLLRRFTPCG